MAASYSSLAHMLMLWFLLLASSAILPVNGSCNYAASCANEGLSGTTLTASCVSVSGSSVTSSIDLNQLISNNNGTLKCPGAGFGPNCPLIGLSGGHTLTADCKNGSGALIQTSLDLNSCITNNDGHLDSCV